MRYKILPIFIPNLGCPHQCVFCDQRSITGISHSITTDEICRKIEEFISEFPLRSTKAIRKEVAFYGGSFTALPVALQRSLLLPAREAKDEGRIQGIRISTRPDACDPPALELLKEYQVDTVELGVQSLDSHVLQLSGRGHGPEESIHALKSLTSEGFITSVQLMPGLPGEDYHSFISTIHSLLSLKPNFVRLYPVLVIKGTELETMYRKGSYTPLFLDEAVNLCAQGIKILSDAGIRVIRCGLQPTASLEGSLCAGPYHPSFGELVESALLFDILKEALSQFIKFAFFKLPLWIKSPPSLFSKVKGQKGGNLKKLNDLYPDHEIFITSDPLIPDHCIEICDENGNYLDVPLPHFYLN